MHWVSWIALFAFIFMLSYDPRAGTINKYLQES